MRGAGFKNWIAATRSRLFNSGLNQQFIGCDAVALVAVKIPVCGIPFSRYNGAVSSSANAKL
jgi:hypothetical protein